MGYPTKIATCCYCGARAALVLNKKRHELACSSCGAPLHDMKSFPQDKVATVSFPSGTGGEKKRSRKKPRQTYGYERARPKYRKKRKGLMRHLLEEAFDIIEDIID